MTLQDVRAAAPADLPDIAARVRARILSCVAAHGGHLASSLGTVELTLALLRTFNPPADKVVWDVGHQAYAWKLLTDRWDAFSTLRTFGGLSGFPNPEESPYDAFIAGHAGAAISVAAGLAAARDARGGGENVVAVVGEASLANGVNLEALENAVREAKRLVLVLNDNTRAASSRKACFEAQGFDYFGPVDGHDVAVLERALAAARAAARPVVVHVATVKGRGFAPAEADPVRWHGVGPFDLAAPEAATGTHEPTWSEVFGLALLDLARRDARVCALTAAMRDGTGLAPFAAAFPERFHDVGICEEHLVSFAAGLARGGLRPVVAVYSTFLQRALDQVVHDVGILKLPVVFAIDRAGVVGADGRTHQGLFDLAFLQAVPQLRILQPRDAADLRAMLAEALEGDGPVAIRYPRGACPALVAPAADPSAPIQLWALGDQVAKANRVAALLAARGMRAGVVHARAIKPLDAAAVAGVRAAGAHLATLENGTVSGGFGMHVGADLRFGWPDAFIPHGSVAELEREYGFTAEAIAGRIAKEWGNE